MNKLILNAMSKLIKNNYPCENGHGKFQGHGRLNGEEGDGADDDKTNGHDQVAQDGHPRHTMNFMAKLRKENGH